MSTEILTPANYREQKPLEFHLPGIPDQNWFAQGPVQVKKASPRIVLFEMPCVTPRNLPTSAKYQALDETYVFENRTKVTQFIEEHRLQNLLVQAKSHLNDRFGTTSIKRLAIIYDDEGFESLFCTVMVPGSLKENMNALRAFDKEWWLAEVGGAAGRLNFDFQLW